MKLLDQVKHIKKNFTKKLDIPAIKNDNLIIYVQKEDLIEFIEFLKTDNILSFKILLDIFGADMLGVRSPRFEVIYNLLSLKLNSRITIKTAIADKISLPTACNTFSAANWYEREVFDMYGIIFDKHPDLRRILTDYSFEGYPLRKDFPLTGHKEMRYDENLKKVIYEKVTLEQEYRNFDFDSPWEGTSYNLPGDEKAEDKKAVS